MDQQQHNLPRNIHDGWIKHQRNSAKTTSSFACIYCLDRRIFPTSDALWRHAIESHHNVLPENEQDWDGFRTNFETEAGLKRSVVFHVPEGKRAYALLDWRLVLCDDGLLIVTLTLRQGYRDTVCYKAGNEADK